MSFLLPLEDFLEELFLFELPELFLLELFLLFELLDFLLELFLFELPELFLDELFLLFELLDCLFELFFLLDPAPSVLTPCIILTRRQHLYGNYLVRTFMFSTH